MKFRSALLAASVLAAPLALAHAASAQPVTGPYVSLGAGYNIPSSLKQEHIAVGRTTIPGTGHIVLHNGYDINASVGYGFGNGFRVELEGDYMDNSVSKDKFGGTDYVSKGSVRRYGAFANVLYDFDVGMPYLYPYVGAGIGWQENELKGLQPAGSYFNKTKGALAYQGIVGVSFPIAPVPGLSATLEYRFVALATSTKYDGEYGGMPAVFKIEHQYNNEINVGLRYALYTPAPMAPAPTPAPVAAPAPAPAKTYLVFFDWDKYNLTPRAQQIISQAASDSHTQNVTTIDVSGYTDTSGTAQYNMGLSQRRAQAVAAQLVTDGVSRSEIEIHAYGETHLLVPTGPGVREPQNRRVEIVLQ
ncbi:MAG: flagellar motor protein MotB [Rhodospirillales bacterium 20-64-7]|nr:MAG: flagellar motor protein MotB [Rhodospirillales bacterium 20-64-7]